MADQSNIAALTAAIVSSYVSNNRVQVTEIGDVIESVGNVLASLSPTQTVLRCSRAVPAVPISKSIEHDHLINLFTGEKFRTLKSTLARKHGMTPREYRAYWGLPGDYPMVSPAYSVKRREMAKALGLGTRIAPHASKVSEPPEEPSSPEDVAPPSIVDISKARKRTLSIRT